MTPGSQFTRLVLAGAILIGGAQIPALAQNPSGVCTQVFDPVCARRGPVMLTYPNPCTAANDRAKVLAHGACPSNCPGVYKPVCGEDAQGVRRNYGNECAAKSDGAKIIRNRRCFFTFRRQ
jgi:Kazal-type serine protease inhibitor-like protein